jgi:hypothetical protein
MSRVFNGMLSSLTNRIVNMVCAISILMSLIFITGCATTITQDYKHKISMSKNEAIETIQKRLVVYWSYDNRGTTRATYDFRTDAVGISAVLPRREYDESSTTNLMEFRRLHPFATLTYPTPQGENYIPGVSYHYEVTLYRDYNRSVYLPFASVIAITRRDTLGPSIFRLYVNKDMGLELRCRKGVVDEATSALLILCPNAGKGPSPTAIKDTDYICYSVGQGKIDEVKSILDANPEMVNVSNDYGTLLCIAAGQGNREIVELLINRGAKVNEKFSRINGDFTPLYNAAGNGHKNVAEFLIAKGAQVNVKMKDGWTPLHIAVWSGHRDVAELLIDKGADVNAKRTTDGTTTLYWAAAKGHADVVKLLLEKGVDINAKTTSGTTALEIAKRNGYAEVVQLLEKAGAKE